VKTLSPINAILYLSLLLQISLSSAAELLPTTSMVEIPTLETPVEEAILEPTTESRVEDTPPQVTPELIKRINKVEKGAVAVEARLAKSTHIEWNRLEGVDPEYIALVEELRSEHLLDSERSYLLPYGLLITVQANSPKSRVALHVDNIISHGDVERTLPAKSLIAYIDTSLNRNYEKRALQHQMDRDIELLGEPIWAEHKSKRLQYRIAFILNTVEGDRSGDYKVRFRFLSTKLP